MRELDELYRDGYISERSVEEIEERLDSIQSRKESDVHNRLSDLLFEREMLKVIARSGGIDM